MRRAFLIFALLLTSCASKIAPDIFGVPVPYLTATPSNTPAPNVVVIVETPQTTSTPFVYTIQSGDTLSQLAERFKISPADLQAANPNINPNSMIIGETLIIPDKSSALAAAWTPTPVPVPITQVICYPANDSGLTCLALIRNITAGMLENISAEISLLDENHNVVVSQTAFAPLDIIPRNAALPVYIFFPNVASNLIPQARLISAVQLGISNPRYLPAKLNNIVTIIDAGGLTAHVSGQIILPKSKAATQIWIAAVAYDHAGQMVGLKRWSGTDAQFNFTVSSLAAAIERVEFIVEARP